jgi:hypothetical protein
MKIAITILLCIFSNLLFAAENNFIAANDVTWNSPGINENDSMPVGNGDLAANVWTEQNGDLVLLVAKADAWTELGQLVKLARVRVKLSPNPFIGTADFSQTLKLETGGIEIKSGANTLQVWVDANHPVIHVEANLKNPATLQANLELWRTTKPDTGGMFELGRSVPIEFAADTVFPASPHQITWCHFNPSSVYPVVLEQEHLSAVANKYPDPLLHRCFGAALTGPDMVSSDDHTLRSSKPGKELRLDLVALTQTQVDSPEAWRKQMDSLVAETETILLKKAQAAHQQWWQDFWNRSWVHVGGTPEATNVSRGYVMQRYMMAASSRGALPVKFNGGLFTVGHDIAGTQNSNAKNHRPDFREWGNSYWNQNNRLLYWPLLATGDFDLLRPWFDLYLNALPMARDRAQIYYHHDGAFFAETMLFWGLPNLNDFGWDNPTTEIKSEWQRYHIQGSLEVILQMLDQYDALQDEDFARKKIVPFADAIVTFYGQHWPRDEKGKIKISPSQSLETYQQDAVNPTPDIAGLNAVIPRLLALPEGFATQAQRLAWEKTLHELPAIPTGTTAHGKLADEGEGDANGTTIILPAEKYGKTKNSENPECYVAFPYRLYGVGKPNLTLARDTFAARRFPQDVCWGQDGPQAAVLGVTAVAQKAVEREFTDYGDERYRWFWSGNHDWIPDLDNGGTGMMALQLMLMQCDGKRIQLLSAWPNEWSADFKLHAPYQTTVEGHVENGKVTQLKVTPASRAKDVVVVSGL